MQADQNNTAQIGTPWTVNNAALPAYGVAQFTPQLPFVRQQALPQAYESISSQPSSPTKVTVGPGLEHTAETAPATGAAAVAAAVASGPPAQAGPLSQYPAYALVDPKARWHRITSWAQNDSHAAAAVVAPADQGVQINTRPVHELFDWGADSGVGVSNRSVQRQQQEAAGPDMDGTFSVRHSLSASMLDLELQRACRSAPGSPEQQHASNVSQSATQHAAKPPHPLTHQQPHMSNASAATTTSQTAPDAAPRISSHRTALPQMGSGKAGLPPRPARHGAVLDSSIMTGGDRGERDAIGLNASVDQLLSLLDSAVPPRAPSAQEAALSLPAAVRHVPTANIASGHRTRVLEVKDIQGEALAPKAEQVQRQACADHSSAASQQVLGDALVAVQRCAAADAERAGLKVATLEAALSSERAHVARLQAQLSTEAARAAAAAEGEAQARQALNAAQQALTSERRKAQEGARKATLAAEEASKQLSAAQQQITQLEARIQDEQATSSRLQRKLTAASKAAEDSQTELHRLQAARQQQDAIVDTTSSQVAMMRTELRSLRSRLASRDKQLQERMKEVEATQMAALHQQLSSTQEQLTAVRGELAGLASPLLSMAQCLAPHTLAAALHLNVDSLTGFSAAPEKHAQVVAHMVAAAAIGSHAAAGSEADGDGTVRQSQTNTRKQGHYHGDNLAPGSLYVSCQDVVALSTRVRELLSVVQQVVLHSERTEVARLSEVHGQLTELQQQLAHTRSEAQEAAQVHAAAEARLQSDLQAALGNAQSSEQEAAGLHAQLVELQASHQQLQGQLQQAASLAGELESRMLHWQQCAEDAQAQLAGLATKDAQAATLAEAKDARLAELRQGLLQAQQECQSLQARLDQQQTASQSNITSLQAQLASSKAAAAAAQAGRDASLQQLHAAQTAVEKAVQEQQLLRTQLQRVQQEAATSAEESAGHHRKLCTLASSIHAAAQQFDASKFVAQIPSSPEQQELQCTATRAVLDAMRELQAHNTRVDSADDPVEHGQQVLFSWQRLTGSCISACVHHMADLQQQSVCLEVLHAAWDALQKTAAAVNCTFPALDMTATRDNLTEQHSCMQELAEVSQLVLACCEQLAAGAQQQATQHSAHVQELLQEQMASKQQVATLTLELQGARQDAQAQLQACSADAHAEVLQLQQELQDSRKAAAQTCGQLAVAQKDINALQALLVVLRRQQTVAEEAAALHKQQAADSHNWLQQTQQQLLALQRQGVGHLQAVQQRHLQAQRVMHFRYQTARRRCIAVRMRCWRLQKDMRAQGLQFNQQLTCMQQEGTGRLAAIQASAAQQLNKEQARTAAVTQHLQETTAKLARAEAVLHKVEERRSQLEIERRSQAEKLTAAAAKAATAEDTAAGYARADAAMKQRIREAEVRVRESDRRARDAEQRARAADAKAATLLQALEGAECALRESQANATRLLQEAQELRASEEAAHQQLQQLQVQKQAGHSSMNASSAKHERVQGKHRYDQSDESPIPSVTASAAGAGTPTRSRSPDAHTSDVHTSGCDQYTKRTAADKEQLAQDVTQQVFQQQAARHTSQLAVPETEAVPGMLATASDPTSKSGLVMHAPVGSTQAALAAKEARIAQLREALTACQLEKASVSERLAALQSGPAGLAATSWADMLQRKADEAASAARGLAAQLTRCQEQLLHHQQVLSRLLDASFLGKPDTISSASGPTQEGQPTHSPHGGIKANYSWSDICSMIEAQAAQLKAYQVELQELSLQKAEHEATAQRLQQLLDRCQSTAHSINAGRQKADQQATELAQQLQQQTQHSGQLQAQVQQLLEQVASLQEQCHGLVTSRMQQLQLQQLPDEATSPHSSAGSSCSDAHSSTGHVQNSPNACNSSARCGDSMHTDVVAAGPEQFKKMASTEPQPTSRRSIHEAHKQAQSGASTGVQLQGKVVQMQAEVEQLREELHVVVRECAAAQAEASTLRRALQHEQDRLAAVQDEAVQLQADRTAVAQQHADALAALAEQLASCRWQLQEAQAEAAAASSDRASCEQRLADVEQQLASLQQEVAVCEARLAAQSEELQQLQEQAASLTQQLQHSQEKHERALQATMDVAQQRMAAAEQELIHNLQQQVATWQEAAHNHQAQAQDLAHSHVVQQEELQQLSAQVQALTAALHAAQDAALTAEQGQAASELKAAALQHEVDASAQHLVQHLQAAQAAHEQVVADLQDKLTSACDRIGQLESEQELGLRRQQDLQAALESAQCEVQASQLEVCALQLEIDAQRQAVHIAEYSAGSDAAHLQDQLKALKAQLQASQLMLHEAEARCETSSSREETYAEEVAEARAEVAAMTQQLESARLHNAQLMQNLTGALQQLQARLAEESEEVASVAASDMTAATTVKLEQQLAGHQQHPVDQAQAAVVLLSENRALLTRLQRTHVKLKLAKGRILELETALALKQATAPLQGGALPASSARSKQSGLSSGCQEEVAEEGVEEQQAQAAQVTSFYQAALQAAQQQAAAAMAQAVDAQQQAASLQRKLQEEQDKWQQKAQGLAVLYAAATGEPVPSSGHSTARQSQSMASSNVPQSTAASSPRGQRAQQGPDLDAQTQTVLQAMHNQQREVQQLQEALKSSHNKRVQEIDKAAALAEELAAAQRQVRELQSATSCMMQQLAQAQLQSTTIRAHLSSQVQRENEAAAVQKQQQQQAVPKLDAMVGGGWADMWQLVEDQALGPWKEACEVQQGQLLQFETESRLLVADLHYTQTLLADAQAKEEEQRARATAAEARLAAFVNQGRLDKATTEQQLLQAEARLQGLSQQLAASQAAVQQAQHEAATARAAQAAAVQAAQAQASDLSHSLKKAVAEKQAAEQQLTQLRQEMLTLVEASKQLAVLGQGSQAAGMLAGLPAGNGGSLSLDDLRHLIHTVTSELSNATQTAQLLQQQLQDANQLAHRRAQELATVQAAFKQQAAEVSSWKEAHASVQAKLQRKEGELRSVEAEIARQLADYEPLRQRLQQQQADSNRLYTQHEAMARKCDELHGALARKQEECAAATARCAQQQEQLAATRNQLAAAQDKVHVLETRQQLVLQQQDSKSEAAVSSLQAELAAAQQQAATLRKQLDQKLDEQRELGQMLKAWEAMRLGKDATIAALMDKCKRHEEAAGEKARTVEALRRKLAAVGRDTSSSNGTAANTPGLPLPAPSGSTAGSLSSVALNTALVAFGDAVKRPASPASPGSVSSRPYP